MENASGEGVQECWFEGGSLESSEMESGIWRDCCQLSPPARLRI